MSGRSGSKLCEIYCHCALPDGETRGKKKILTSNKVEPIETNGQ